MDVIAAYREVGTLSGGRGDLRHDPQDREADHRGARAAGEGGRLPERVPRARNYDEVAELVAAEGEEDRGPDHRRSGCCRPRGRPAMRGRTATSGGWSPRRRASGVVVRHGPVAAGRRCGRRVRCWSSTGARRSWRAARSTCSARCWRGRGSGSSGSPPTSSRPPRWRCWRSASRSSAGSRRSVLADRMGCLKGGVVANVVVPTPDYVRFATHYRFRPDFCQAADPESKGIVENLVGYAKADLLVPLELDDDPWGDGSGRAQRLRAGLVRGGQRRDVTSEICAVPAERLVTERRAAAARCRRCGSRSARSRSPGRSTSCRASGSGRPATRCRTG